MNKSQSGGAFTVFSEVDVILFLIEATSKEIGKEIEGQVSGKLVYISNFMDKEEVKEKILKAIRN